MEAVGRGRAIEVDMDGDRDLLFGLLAFQAGAIDAGQLAETVAGLDDPARTVGVGETLAARGTLTDEQSRAVGRMVEEALARHGGDPAATLAATVDGRSLDALRSRGALPPALAEAAGAGGDETVAEPAGHVLISTLDRGDGPGTESRDHRYALTRLHAKGGMGQVWKARDVALGRDIALKELRPESAGDSAVWSRFLYEAKVTARLEHPGVVPVYEMGGGESPYYTMRFVKGRTLSEATRAYHKLREAGAADADVELVRLLSAFVSVCLAIDYAHSRGIIHRDLKGQNVVLGDFGEVIVLDWGLAKQVGADRSAGLPAAAAPPSDPEAATIGVDAAELATLPFDPPPEGLDAPADPDATIAAGPSLATPAAPIGPDRESGAGPEGTMQGQLLGTPAYMAPEQASGRHGLVDFRTDVYGLGAILYEILAGQPPFLAKRASEILRMVVDEPPAPARSLNPAAPPDLQAACLKALAKDRDDRYATAGDLARDVQRHLADEPVSAFDEPWPRRAARWARKHRTAVAAAGVLLVASTVASGIGTVIVDRWRDEAEAQGALARSTVDDMYARVGESWLEDRLDPIQKEFLEKAVAFYEGRAKGDDDAPDVRLEHGRTLRRVADVYAKFGRFDEAEKAYRRSLDRLRPLVVSNKGDREARREVASTADRFAEALFRRDRLDDAAPLFAEAEDLSRPLALPDDAAADDRRLLARVLRGRGQLLRRKGDLAAAGPAYAEACTLLEKARAGDPASAEVRGELAQSEDFLARCRRETGDLAAAEAASRKAYGLLDGLVAEYPTIPRHREALARTCAELGWFAYEDARLDEAETLWGRGWREASRLAEDYPDRPEYTLNLAGAATNYGGVLVDLGRVREAEPILRRAVELNSGLAERSPDDRQVRFDLAKCRFNLGYLLLKRGRIDEAVAEIEKARDLNATLVAERPDVPRNRHYQATYLRRLGEALDAAGRPGGEAAYREALALLEKLTADHPDNAAYRLDLARCLTGLGNQQVAAGKLPEAEATFVAGLAALDALAAGREKPGTDVLRETSTVLSNLGSTRQGAGAGDAEGPIRRAVAISEELARREPPADEDLEALAVARITLAEALRARGAADEAAPLFAQAVEGMKGLAARTPASPDRHFYLGYMLAKQAAAAPRPEDARAALQEAVAHDRRAVELTSGRNPTYRELLVEAMTALADADLKLADYDDARKVAMEIPRESAAPGPGCVAAARLLARLAAQARGDEALEAPRRDALERQGLSGAVLLLREALDADPKLDADVKADPAFKDLLARAEFQLLLGSLASPTPR